MGNGPSTPDPQCLSELQGHQLCIAPYKPLSTVEYVRNHQNTPMKANIFIALILSAVVIATARTITAKQYTCAITEHEAMVAIYIALGGPAWTAATDWNLTPEHCAWTGVTCNRNGDVTGIMLNSVGATGFLPSEVGCLLFLKTLYLNDNEIGGTLPAELANLENLKYFQMHHNLLDGNMPDGLCALQHLQYMYLDHNLLNGPIPTCVHNMTYLREAHLQCNNLTGDIPAEEFVGLQFLEELFLECNDFNEPTCPPLLVNHIGLIFTCEGNCTECPTLPVIEEPGTELEPCPEEIFIEGCGTYQLIPSYDMCEYGEDWSSAVPDEPVIVGGIVKQTGPDTARAGLLNNRTDTALNWSGPPQSATITFDFLTGPDIIRTTIDSPQLPAPVVASQMGVYEYLFNGNGACAMDNYDGLYLCFRTQYGGILATSMTINGGTVEPLPNPTNFYKKCFFVETPDVDYSMNWAVVLEADFTQGTEPETVTNWMLVYGHCAP